MSASGEGSQRWEAPTVSVIIPTFRREAQLIGAIGSVLEEALAPIEVLVIDDSPECSARSVVSEIGDVRVVYRPMLTPSGGRPALVRNRGMELARGRYLYFLDDDDLVAPGGLAALARSLDSHPAAAVAYGLVTCVGPDRDARDRYNRWFSWAGRTAKRLRHSSWLTTGIILFRGTTIINSCCMIRRDRALQLGGYDPALEVYEDVDFFARGIRQFGHVFVDAPVLVYSTGLHSIIHDLHGDNTPIQRSYALMHARYKRTHGIVDYRCLQVLSKLALIGSPEQQSPAAQLRYLARRLTLLRTRRRATSSTTTVAR